MTDLARSTQHAITIGTISRFMAQSLFSSIYCFCGHIRCIL